MNYYWTSSPFFFIVLLLQREIKEADLLNFVVYGNCYCVFFIVKQKKVKIKNINMPFSEVT